MKEALEILCLIVIANAAPVLARLAFSHNGALAIDFGKRFKDQRFIFGINKTWRGLFSSILITGITAITLGYALSTGIIIASLAMAGDLLSSFIKRRLNKTSGSNVFLLDQLPESIFPVLFMTQVIELSLIQVIAIILSFIIIELILSTLLIRFNTSQNSHV